MQHIKDILGGFSPSEETLAHMEEAQAENLRKFKEQKQGEADIRNERLDDDDFITKAMMESGVPPRYAGARVSDIPNSNGTPEAWKNGKNIVLCGETGVGKTHFAVALMAYRCKEDKWGVRVEGDRAVLVEPVAQKFVTVPELMVRLRGRMKDGMSDVVLTEMISRPVLILDDLGAEKSTDWVLEVLYYIIDTRYSHLKQTMVTTNLTLGQLSDKLGDRIASRLAGMAKPIAITGGDRRVS